MTLTTQRRHQSTNADGPALTTLSDSHRLLDVGLPQALYLRTVVPAYLYRYNIKMRSKERRKKKGSGNRKDNGITPNRKIKGKREETKYSSFGGGELAAVNPPRPIVLHPKGQWNNTKHRKIKGKREETKYSSFGGGELAAVNRPRGQSAAVNRLRPNVRDRKKRTLEVGHGEKRMGRTAMQTVCFNAGDT
ncbi:hypothetical protein M514_05493 [Trichuris suis]|uniref:Uncharacterized protein n=1 Tax=Trichuris suis TaxID=68888 RepID=A0A085N002_9BILA|nr:hypothetical protein M513_05493 [Trichuris suis]KFD62798.1 hypothetical protein M514_05493 [Trichuris suis]